MADVFVIVNKNDLTAIADAVREATGETTLFKVSQLNAAVARAIAEGSIDANAIIEAYVRENILGGMW